MSQKFPIYYLCNKNNEKIIEFSILFYPTDFVIPEAKVINKALLPNLFDTECKLNEFLGLYLTGLIPDNGRGWDLDEYIIKKLRLDYSVGSYGRLYGMDYIITLLETHFKDEVRGLYITPKEPTSISFIGQLPGWNRLFLDRPVEWSDVNVLNAQK